MLDMGKSIEECALNRDNLVLVTDETQKIYDITEFWQIFKYGQGKSCPMLSFAAYWTNDQFLGRIEAPTSFNSRIYYSNILLKEEEFVEMIEKYKHHRDTYQVLTEEIIAEVKNLAGCNAALTSLCLEIITRDFPRNYEARTEGHIQDLISNGTLDDHLVNQKCRAFRSFEEMDEYFLDDNEKSRFIKVLGELIKKGQYRIDGISSAVSAMLKLGICVVSLKIDRQCLEFACPLTAIYYQKYIIIKSFLLFELTIFIFNCFFFKLLLQADTRQMNSRKLCRCGLFAIFIFNLFNQIIFFFLEM